MRNSVAGLRRGVNARRPTARGPWLFLLPSLVMLMVTALLAFAGDFDGLYGQDAYAYYDYAVGPLRESVLALQPPPRFYWPPGYPLLVALLSLIVGTTPLASQLISLGAGVLVPVVTVLLAYDLWPTRGERRLLVALLAGTFVAINGQLWQSSIVVMSDTTALAAGTLSALAVVRYERYGRLRWLVLAAGAMAWAILTRWAYLLVALPVAAHALWKLLQQPRRQVLVHASVATFVVGVVLGPVIVPAVDDLVRGDDEYVAFAAAGEIYDWHPRHAFQREHVTADGLLRYRLPNGLFYALAPARPIYFTPIVAAFIVPGLWSVLRRRRTEGRILLLVGWPAMVYGFHAGTAWQNFRFTLAWLPPLAILAAVGVVWMWQRLRGRWRMLLGAILTVTLLWMVYGGLTLTNNLIERKQADVATVRWVEAQVPADARLLAFELTLTLQHESTLDTRELYLLTPDDLMTLLADGPPTYLLLDPVDVTIQWQRRAPEINYMWLRNHVGLTELGTHRQYTLFRVGELYR